MLKLHNTLTRQIEVFQPIKSGQVRLYTCGPTVYDNQTIGNLRTYVFYDTLARVLRNQNFKLSHVMNITDVGHLTSDADEGEDKLEKGAVSSGKTVWEVADYYTKRFNANLKQMNIKAPKLVKATDFIDAQVGMIKALTERGYAYQTKQAIYFDTRRLKNYGELTGQKLDDMEVGARSEVVTDDDKKHPQDFGLWFFTTGHYKNHTMHWPSPWGEGFPGWHLECSAIIHETLGDPIDIHAGAVDLIGTHHTNEMAQTEAAFGHKLANFWLHGEHLLVNSSRMGKSLGNFYTLDDIVDKGFDPMALRLLYLQAHYRNKLNFTWESLSASSRALHSFQSWADLKFQDFKSTELKADYAKKRTAFVVALDQDLDTPKALAIFSGMTNSTADLGIDSESVASLAEFVDSYFGLDLSNRKDISSDLKHIVSARETARQSKKWAEADKLRQKLLDQGIEVNDTPAGPAWSRIATKPS